MRTLSVDDLFFLPSHQQESTEQIAVNTGSGLAVAARASRENEFVHSAFRIENGTERPFGTLTFAFDLVYRYQDGSEPGNLYFEYRTQNGRWKSVESAALRTARVAPDPGEWNYISTQFTLSDIFLSPGEEVHIRWLYDESWERETEAVMALQRLEVMPRPFEFATIQNGELMVTEILPYVDEGRFRGEFIEIYNPGPDSILLQGIAVATQAGSYRIQTDKILPPYQLFTIGSVSNPSEDTVLDYVYEKPLITTLSGTVFLQYNDRELARITYSAPEPGVAMQLTHTAAARDGYTSMQDLEPVSIRRADGLFASPGSLPAEKRFTRIRHNPGWTLFSAPGPPMSGAMSPTLSDVRVYPIQWDETGFFTDPQAGEELFFIRSEEGATRSYLNREFSWMPLGEADGKYLYANANGKPMSIHSLRDALGTAPDGWLIWDARSARFDYQPADEDPVAAPWSVVMISREVAYTEETNNVRGDSRNAEFQIPLVLANREEGGSVRAEIRVDTRQLQDERDQLPAFFPLSAGTVHQEKDHLALGLRSVTNPNFSNRPSSYIRHTLNEDGRAQFLLDLYSSDRSGQYTLHWRGMQVHDEAWIVELTHLPTGRTVNMLEESEITLPAIHRIPEPTDNGPHIQPMTPTDSDWLISIYPQEVLSERPEQDEIPESVNLRQNYPNPFNPATTISFYLPEQQHVRLSVFNIVGQQVELLEEGTLQAGDHTRVWDATSMPSGVYIIHLEAGQQIFSRKMTLIK
ncbi:MAG: T9SS type A sorting domain-containing protein [Balneolaceae bacterium]